MTDRRYSEDEVRAIFKGAAAAPSSDSFMATGTSGLTLAEMRSIAVEAGIDPESIVRVASALDMRPGARTRNVLGMPTEVLVVAPLPRALDEREWDTLVAELRRTFHAEGKTTVAGSQREWRNSKLYVVIEPAERGHRIVMGTTKQNAAYLNGLGGAGLLASAATWATHFAINDPHQLTAPVLFGLVGAASFVANMLRLPPWARRREQQFNEIAARARAMTDQLPQQNP